MLLTRGGISLIRAAGYSHGCLNDTNGAYLDCQYCDYAGDPWAADCCRLDWSDEQLDMWWSGQGHNLSDAPNQSLNSINVAYRHYFKTREEAEEQARFLKLAQRAPKGCPISAAKAAGLNVLELNESNGWDPDGPGGACWFLDPDGYAIVLPLIGAVYYVTSNDDIHPAYTPDEIEVFFKAG